MLSGAKLCGALSALVVAMAVLPVATASATPGGSSICKAYNAEETKEVKASAALAKDVDSDNWAVIKKDLLATFKGESSAEKGFDAYLSGASAKVKSAAAVVLKLDSTFKTIVQSSSSLTAYEKGITAAEETPKVHAALKVLDSYTTALCGATTSNT
ncbi:MAG: hypothetical protein ABSH29_22830 [Acidimicrobiales bacterium]|jgi:hypothetical protein